MMLRWLRPLTMLLSAATDRLRLLSRVLIIALPGPAVSTLQRKESGLLRSFQQPSSHIFEIISLVRPRVPKTTRPNSIDNDWCLGIFFFVRFADVHSSVNSHGTPRDARGPRAFIPYTAERCVCGTGRRVH